MKKFTAPLRIGDPKSPSVQMSTSSTTGDGDTSKNPHRRVMTLPRVPGTNTSKKNDGDVPVKKDKSTNFERKATTSKATDAGKSPVARSVSGTTSESRPQSSTFQAPTSGDGKHKNTARKMMPRAPNPSTSKPKKPTVSLTDQAYEDIFQKVIVPSPTMEISSANSSDDSTTKMLTGTHDISESDFEESDNDGDALLKKDEGANSEGKATTSKDSDTGKSAVARGVSGTTSESRRQSSTFQVPTSGDGKLRKRTARKSMPKVRAPNPSTNEPKACWHTGEGPGHYKLNIVDSPTIEKSTQRIPMEAAITESDMEDSDVENISNIYESMEMGSKEFELTSSKTSSNALKPKSAPSTSEIDPLGPESAFRGFPRVQQTTALPLRPFPSRRLFPSVDVSTENSEEWNPPESIDSCVQSTPVNARVAKRSLDYDETPVARFPRKKSAGIKEIADEDKENIDVCSESTATKATKKHSSESSYHTAASESSYDNAAPDATVRLPLSDKSNTSSGAPSETPVVRGPVPFEDVYEESGGFPSSANASHEPTDEDELMPPPSSQRVIRPLSQNSSRSQNSAQEESNDSASLRSSQASTYSVPPPHLDMEAKLEWLLPRRMIGTWVQCDRCKKWRYFKDTHDPTVFPKLWYCNLNPDRDRNRCEIEEQRMRPKDEALMILNEYAPGSIVWAKCDGFPWWPAVVDDDPDYFQFYWFDGEATEIPTQYHVVFFGKVPSRAWVKLDEIKPFKQLQPASGKRLLQAPIKEAEKAVAMSQEERLRKYGMLARFGGRIGELVSSRGRRTVQNPPRSTGNSVASSPASHAEAPEQDRYSPDY